MTSSTLFDYKKGETRENRPDSVWCGLYSNGRYFSSEQIELKPAEFVFTEHSQNLPLYVRFEPGEADPIVNFDLLQTYWSLQQILQSYYANPLSALASSKTMLLPHQVQVALRVVDDLRQRILIADEVGLGKTIEAGLIIKELIFKYNYSRVLIVAPSPLLRQWQNELKNKFNENFEIVTGEKLKKDRHLLEKQLRVMVSIDLAKEPRYREMFQRMSYDIIVFDEAHRLRRDQHAVTKAYQFAEMMSSHTRALVLLSATPFRGKLEELYYLVQLIDPDILGPLPNFLHNYEEENRGDLKKKLASVIVRRRKVDVGGFTKRFARTVKLGLSPIEQAFYDATTDYVKKEYNRALLQGQRIKSFVMIVFQKLLDSSSYALLQALEKRKARLEASYYRLPGFIPESELHEKRVGEFLQDEEDIDDLENAEDLLSEEPIYDPKEMFNEIQSLGKLIELGKKIDIDNKLLVLEKNIKMMKKSGHSKFLIFTQFKSTMDYIAAYLKREFSVSCFHGSLSASEKEKVIEEFYEGRDILILTEAGGEGRNLQIASALFNYDLPWSPLKVEQRIGRIHRFGQKKDVHIVNFATKDTVAERVLDILEHKIRLFEDTIGESDALLGVLEDELGFDKNFKLFLQEKKSRKEWEAEVANSLKMARENVSRISDLISTEFIDFDMQAFSRAINSRSSAPTQEKNLAAIVKKYCQLVGRHFEEKSDLFSYDSGRERKLGTFSYEKAAEKDSLEYLAIGHSFIDQVIHGVLSACEKGKIYQLSGSREQGIFFQFQITVFLDRGYRRLYSVFVDRKSNLASLNPESFQERIGKKSAMQAVAGSINDYQRELEIALDAVQKPLKEEILRLQKKVNSAVHYWQNNIEKSHRIIESQIEEKLAIQKGKAAWYGEQKMAGAISRTMNQKREEELRASRKLRELSQSRSMQVEVDVRHICLFN